MIRSLIISGPSGVGKTTVAQKIIESGDFEKVVTITTRSKREKEVDGIDYNFLDTENFKKQLDCGEFVEFTQVYGHYYGTPKSELIRIHSKGLTPLLLLDTKGHSTYKKQYDPCCSFFLSPPSLEILRERLLGRGQSNNIEDRIKQANIEMSHSQDYDHIIVNHSLSETVQEILEKWSQWWKA